MNAKLVRLTNEDVAKWRISADVWVTVAGRASAPKQERSTQSPASPPARARLVKVRARRAQVTFEFDVKRASTVRGMHVAWGWAAR